MKRFVLCIAALVGLIDVIGLACPAQAGDIVGLAIDSQSTLFKVDLTTATASVIGPTGVGHIEGLAISPDGKVLGTDSRGELYSINSTTGSATFIGKTHLGDVEGLGFRGPTLLGVNFGDPTRVYAIDPTNAHVTPLVTTNPAAGPARAMALENDTTALLVSDTPRFQTLLSLDLETGATSALDTLHPTASVLAAMAFGPDRKLYGIDAIGDEYMISPSNGALTLMGNIEAATSPGQFTDMAIMIVPEPQSWVILTIGMSIAAVCFCVHRRRAVSA
jgi:hypothetical protein